MDLVIRLWELSFAGRGVQGLRPSAQGCGFGIYVGFWVFRVCASGSISGAKDKI